jgi:protein-tyrosine phosphatase
MEIFEIKPNLFQSTKIDDPNAVKEMDTVIDLEGGFDTLYELNIKSYLYWHILDMPWLPDERNLWNVARYGFNAWKAGQTVLVHCSMGRNRSGLVNGCILWLDEMSGIEAVKLIQKKRPGALVNPVFRNYLENLSERR